MCECNYPHIYVYMCVFIYMQTLYIKEQKHTPSVTQQLRPVHIITTPSHLHQNIANKDVAKSPVNNSY